MIYLTSDNHFYHGRIIEYCQRPYGSVSAMNHDMIKNWNRVVSHDDQVYVIGDFAMTRDPEKIYDLIRTLNGKIVLVLGNHDEQVAMRDVSNRAYREIRPDKFEVTHYQEIKYGGIKFIMCHFPFTSWNGAGRGSVNLHGHTHGNLPSTNQQYDVGVDANNHEYAPISLDQVMQRLKSLPAHKFIDVVRNQYGNR